MKKFFPVILGITVAGTLATCTQDKDDVPSPSEQTTTSPQPISETKPAETIPGANGATPVNTGADTTPPPSGSSSSRGSGSTATTPDASTPVGQITPPPPATATSATKLIDRTVKYKTPGGLHSVEFNLTITDGKIANVIVTPTDEHEITHSFQTKFGKEIGKVIIGKSAKDLKISTTAGASLTTKAFNEFITDMSAKGEL